MEKLVLQKALRASLEVKSHGGRALFGIRGLLGFESDKFRMMYLYSGVTASEKFRSRRGNITDHQLGPQI